MLWILFPVELGLSDNQMATSVQRGLGLSHALLQVPGESFASRGGRTRKVLG